MLCDRYEPVSQAVSGERERELHVILYIKISLFHGEGMTLLHRWINIRLFLRDENI